MGICCDTSLQLHLAVHLPIAALFISAFLINHLALCQRSGTVRVHSCSRIGGSVKQVCQLCRRHSQFCSLQHQALEHAELKAGSRGRVSCGQSML